MTILNGWLEEILVTLLIGVVINGILLWRDFSVLRRVTSESFARNEEFHARLAVAFDDFTKVVREMQKELYMHIGGEERRD